MGKVTGANLISGLIRKRSEVAGQLKVAQKAAEAVKSDLAALDRALEICGYTGDPRGIAPRTKYKQMFGRSELKRLILDQLRTGPKDDEAIAAQIILAKGWDADDELRADILKRVRHAIQRLRNTDYIVQDFGPDGCLWKRVER